MPGFYEHVHVTFSWNAGSTLHACSLCELGYHFNFLSSLPVAVMFCVEAEGGVDMAFLKMKTNRVASGP